MVQILQSVKDIADKYEAIVLDQWGVLHDGTKPYKGTVECVTALAEAGHRLAILSNSGKRATSNSDRIADMGFPVNLFEYVMTSGEALWRDVASAKIAEQVFFPIEREMDDANSWSEGLNISFISNLGDAEAILLMGLPDGDTLGDWRELLGAALERDLVLYCSNPDMASPRADGLVISPGTLAHYYQSLGGKVVFYGKPHKPIFDALKSALDVESLLMIGDSLDHDITGAYGAGWDSLLIQSGLYAKQFSCGEWDAVMADLLKQKSCPPPTYTMGSLQ